MREAAIWLGLLLGAANVLAATTTGTVITLDGEPLAGAQIHAHAPEPQTQERRRLVAGGDRPPLASTTSDDAGSFSLPVPAGGVLEIVVELDGYAPWTEKVMSGGELGAVLLRQAPRVRGHVRVTGRPLAGARVVWNDHRGRPLWVAETDDQGSYQVPDPSIWAGSVTVLHPRVAVLEQSSSLGFLALHEEPWDTGDSLPLALEPSRGRSITGRVVADGRAVADAEIEAAGWPLARSDGDGRFAVRVPEGQVLQARAGARWGWALAGTGDGEVTIALADPRSLHVTVEDRRGRGLAGAEIQLFARAEAPFMSRYVADRDGRIEIDGLPAARLNFWTEVPDHRIDKPNRQIDLSRRQEAEARVVAQRSARVLGRVVDGEGRAIAGALVLPGAGRRVRYGLPPGLKRVARSGEDGRFELALALDEGETASLEVLTRGWAARTVELPAADRDRAEAVEVRLPAGVAAAFSVTDVEGKPLSGVTVAIVEGVPEQGRSPQTLVAQGDFTWLYRTDHDGQAEARLRPGIHHLGFHAEGFAPFGVARYDARAGAGRQRIVLRPGAEIEGRVVTTSGRPAGTVVVQAQGESFEARARTSAGGRFRLEELPAGTYVVTASVSEGLAPAPITVEAPARGVTIRFDDGLELSGVVVDRSTRLPVATANVSAEFAGTNNTRSGARPTTTDDGGRFTLRGLRAGRIVLRVAAEGFLESASEELEIESSEPSPEVEIELDPGLTLSGTVTGDRGEPLADVAVKIKKPHARRDVTGASGEYLLHGLPPGTVEVAFVSEDFLARSEAVELAAPGGRLDVELERGQILPGVVRDLEGAAVEHARIRGWRRGLGSKWSQSDDQGSFELRGLAPGEWQLRVSKNGFVEQQLTRLVPSRSAALEVILQPAATGTVTGTVRGADRTELATLTVQVRSRSQSARAEVEEDGSYRVEEAPAGDVTVRLSVAAAESERSLTRRTVVPDGGRARVDFDLEDAPRIRGRVVRGEDPVLAARVQFERIGGDDRATTRTGAGGWFEVEIEAGSYQVSVSTSDDSRHHERMEITGTSILEIDVSPAGLEGRVVDAMTGEGLAGAAIELRPVVRREEDRSYSLPEVTADSRGRFTMVGAPIGRFMLSAHAAEFAPQLVEVELEGGVERFVEIVLEPAAGLDVVLFDARSGTILHGTVVVRVPSDAVIWDGAAPRSGDGVRLPLAAGDYKVSVSAGGYASQTVPARVPAREPLRVGLTPGGTVVVASETLAPRVAKLIAPDGEEYVRCWCNKISAFRLEGSRTVLENIAPGSYTLMVFDPDGTSQALPLQVFEGLSVEVAVR